MGFSGTPCLNQILINEIECPLVSSSISELICKFSELFSFEPNVDYNLEVRVKNIGFAIPDRNFAVKFIPVITEFYPNIGNFR